MSNKEAFILLVEQLINSSNIEKLKEDKNNQKALKFFEEFKNEQVAEITENGMKILQYMQDNWKQYNNIFTSKIIGEGIFASSRSVSGSMRKLILGGFVEKIGNNPVSYSITDKGINKTLEEVTI